MLARLAESPNTTPLSAARQNQNPTPILHPRMSRTGRAGAEPESRGRGMRASVAGAWGFLSLRPLPERRISFNQQFGFLGFCFLEREK